MLALMCKAASNRFAVDARQVLEVVPRVRLQSHASPGTAVPGLSGMCIYRGRILPVLDLAQLAAGTNCPDQWSSRILLVQCTDAGSILEFGLIVEQVSVAQISSERKAAEAGPGIASWGPLLLDDEGIFQLLDVSRVLGADRHASLLSRSLERTDG